MRKRAASFLAVLAATAWLTACGVSVNEDVYVEDGERRGSVTSVNGSIVVGSDSRIGSCTTVNGRIKIGRGSQSRELTTVNGSIRIAADARVDGDVQTVNGRVECDEGVEIDGSITVVNGEINLRNVIVHDHLQTHNGEMDISAESRIRGDVVIEGDSDAMTTLRIRIAEGSIVEGDLIVEERTRKVRVYLESGGKINGDVRGAEVVRRD